MENLHTDLRVNKVFLVMDFVECVGKESKFYSLSPHSMAKS